MFEALSRLFRRRAEDVVQELKVEIPALGLPDYISTGDLRQQLDRRVGIGQLFGSIEYDDFQELFAAIDQYNAGKSEKHQASFLIHKDWQKHLANLATAGSGIFSKENPMNEPCFALRLDGYLFRADYFNDWVMNSGFSFYAKDKNGCRIRFLTGLPEKMTLEDFAQKIHGGVRLTEPQFQPVAA